ncbi:MAG: hypothetical protein Q8Q09_10645 [Deltaproteobacteria bacterium]|nr:hypothetical protein [Deltaproteobacteria bacterium]
MSHPRSHTWVALRPYRAWCDRCGAVRESVFGMRRYIRPFQHKWERLSPACVAPASVPRGSRDVR